MLDDLFLDLAKSSADVSPLMHTLLSAAAEDLKHGGITTEVMAGTQGDQKGTVPALRFAAALHRLVLTGQEPGLARHYPTVGGELDSNTLWADAREVLHKRTEELNSIIITKSVQTNETGRSAPLFGGLHTASQLAADAVQSDTPFPIRLLEVGASGGLNLRPHRFAYQLADRVFGDPASPVVIQPQWTGLPEADPSVPLRFVERAACDLNPVDVTTDEGRLHLSSFVWGDQKARLERMWAAIELARQDPVPVQQATGAQWLAEQLAEPIVGALTVVWHSVVWQYVSPADRAAGRAVIADAARRATNIAPLALLVFEPRRFSSDNIYECQLLLRLWPAGISLSLGAGRPHGVPFTWKTQPWE